MTIRFSQPEGETGRPAAVINLLPEIGKEKAVEDILKGLNETPKRISPMFFYDAEGSRLFEEITRLPEYYLTRVEMQILEEAAELLSADFHNMDIVEIGSGNCAKISVLLESVPAGQLGTLRYHPVDVSQAAVQKSTRTLITRFPGLEVKAVVADFTRQIHLIPRQRQRMFCFFGSTIGNLDRDEARRLMGNLGRSMMPDDSLLLGIDMVKAVDVLEAAYNDSRRVTERFNRNILKVVNHLAGTDFIPHRFEHVAFYNEDKQRIEMHLRAMGDMMVTSPHASGPIMFSRGEAIHTENSHKYTREHIKAFAAAADLVVADIFHDPEEWFCLVHYKKSAKR